MQLPASIGSVSTSPQPITAERFAFDVQQQQHLPLLPHLLQNILSKKGTWKAEGAGRETATADANCEGCVTASVWPHAPGLCYTHTSGQFCCGCCCRSKCFEPLLWNIICRRETQVRLKYHSGDCKLWTGTQVGLTSSDMLYPTFSSFSLSSYTCLKAVVNVQDLFPYSKTKVLQGVLFPRWIQVTAWHFYFSLSLF